MTLMMCARIEFRSGKGKTNVGMDVRVDSRYAARTGRDGGTIAVRHLSHNDGLKISNEAVAAIQTALYSLQEMVDYPAGPCSLAPLGAWGWIVTIRTLSRLTMGRGWEERFTRTAQAGSDKRRL